MIYRSKTAAARAIVDGNPGITADSFLEIAEEYTPVPDKNAFYLAAREWRTRHSLGRLPQGIGGPASPVNHGLSAIVPEAEALSFLLGGLTEGRRSRAAKRALAADLARKSNKTTRAIHSEIVARFGRGIDHCTVGLIVRQVRFGRNISVVTTPATLKFGLTELEMSLVKEGKSLVNQMNRPGSRFNSCSCLVYVHSDVIDQLLNYKRAEEPAAVAEEPPQSHSPDENLRTLTELVWEWMDNNSCKAVTFSEDGSVRVEDKPVVTRSFSLVKEDG